MKVWFLILLTLTVAAVFESAEAQNRVWTRSDGNTVRAGIAKATQTHVTLKLANGREYEMKLADLAAPDRAYVLAWLEQSKNRPKDKYLMSFWTYTKDGVHAGTNGIDLYLEINQDRSLRYHFPDRNFARSGVEEFAGIQIGINPAEIREIKMAIVSGEDLWEPKQFSFQFSRGKLSSEKIDFPARRVFSMDKSEGDQEMTFEFSRKIALNQVNIKNSETEAEVIKMDPVLIKNPKPGDNTPVSHYVIESDQSRGTLELEFEHKLIESSLTKMTSAVLVMHVPDKDNASTKSTVSVWSGRKSIALKQGATRGQPLRIEMDPSHFDGKRSVLITLKCGDDAVFIVKGAKGPVLEATFD